jgi:hypothetical protein
VKQFAGHAETGKLSSTDPAMGQSTNKQII